MYSGQTAGYSYSIMKHFKNSYKNVYLIGPSHFLHIDGISFSSADSLQTPLGNLKVN